MAAVGLRGLDVAVVVDWSSVVVLGADECSPDLNNEVNFSFIEAPAWIRLLFCSFGEAMSWSIDVWVS